MAQTTTCCSLSLPHASHILLLPASTLIPPVFCPYTCSIMCAIYFSAQNLHRLVSSFSCFPAFWFPHWTCAMPIVYVPSGYFLFTLHGIPTNYTYHHCRPSYILLPVSMPSLETTWDCWYSTLAITNSCALVSMCPLPLSRLPPYDLDSGLPARPCLHPHLPGTVLPAHSHSSLCFMPCSDGVHAMTTQPDTPSRLLACDIHTS